MLYLKLAGLKPADLATHTPDNAGKTIHDTINGVPVKPGGKPGRGHQGNKPPDPVDLSHQTGPPSERVCGPPT